MKSKFLLLGMVVITISLSSCQKSIDQMTAAPQKSSAVKTIKSRDVTSNEDLWAKILPYIVEPRYTHFGDPDSKLIVGDKPVFYFPISDLVFTNPNAVITDAFSGTLTLTDSGTDEILGVYEMTSGFDPSAANYEIPDDIKNLKGWYLFTQAEMTDNFVRKIVNMSANFRLISGESITVELRNAFLVN